MNTECRRDVRLRRINFNIDGAKRLLPSAFDIRIHYSIFVLAVFGFIARLSDSMMLDRLAFIHSPGTAVERAVSSRGDNMATRLDPG